MYKPHRKPWPKSKSSDIWFLSRVPVHCITPFCSDALVSPPNLYPPWEGELATTGALHPNRKFRLRCKWTYFYWAFYWKNQGNNWKIENVVLFSLWKLSNGNACSIYEFSKGISSSRLFTAISVPPSWILVTRAFKRMELVSNSHVLLSMDLSMEISQSVW